MAERVVAMASVEDAFRVAVQSLGPRPPDDAPQSVKNPWVGKLSGVLALALADQLRARGMKQVRPAEPGALGLSGAERRLAGGIGAKRVDVTWATDESGLMFAASVKTIMYRDGKTGNYQKNLTNRRGDLLFEAVTLHRRFPYAVLSGWLFLDVGASQDGTSKRKSTFENAFSRLRLFTGRRDPAGREEQFERLFLILLDANPFSPTFECYEVNDSSRRLDMDQVLSELVELTAERNFDLYEAENGIIRRSVSGVRRHSAGEDVELVEDE